MMNSDAHWASMTAEDQAEYARIFGTEEERAEHQRRRLEEEPFGLNVYAPEQWRRRRRLDVIRIVYANGGAATFMFRKKSRRV